MTALDESAAPDHHAAAGDDPLLVVIDALRHAGRSVDAIDVDDRSTP